MNKLKEYPPVRRMNGVNSDLGSWYPPNRPQQFYRLAGNTTTILGDMNDTFWSFGDTIVTVHGGAFQFEGDTVPLEEGEQLQFTLHGKTYRMRLFGKTISWSVSDGSTAVWTNLNDAVFSCQAPPTYGKQFKMLGKDADGAQAHVDCAPQGSVISFSGRAVIRPPPATPSKKFYADTSQYLKSRGNTFAAKAATHKVPGVAYASSAGAVVWPAAPQTVAGYDFPLNSAWYQGSGAEKAACNLTVYKPSNYKYSVQGAVSSGARLDRIKLNLVTDTPKKFHNKKCCKFAR